MATSNISISRRFDFSYLSKKVLRLYAIYIRGVLDGRKYVSALALIVGAEVGHPIHAMALAMGLP